MMDDVFIYHAHTFFVLLCACLGYLDFVLTSASRELTIRALESEPHTFDHDSFIRHISYHFGIVKNAQGHACKVTSFLRLDIVDHTSCVACTICAHVRDIASPMIATFPCFMIYIPCVLHPILGVLATII